MWRRLLRQPVHRRLCTLPRSSRRSCCAFPHSFTRVRPHVATHRVHLQCSRSHFTPTDASSTHGSSNHVISAAATLKACPGCGALAQTVESDQPGFYSTKRVAVRGYLKLQPAGQPSNAATREDELVTRALENVDSELLQSLDLYDVVHPEQSQDVPTDVPLCDRCHDLVHHHKGVSIVHPSIESIQDTLAESPYKYNHIYHVLDAADFPLSLVPNVHRALDAAFQRSRNRRSKLSGYKHGRKTEISFIIARSDLLAPKKEQVDSMMPYFTSVLRDALGSTAQDVRLGNVRCVSAKRGWWTRELKADIWNRGAGGWMFGKVNVGKSKLFEAVFPKGHAQDIDFDKFRSESRLPPPTSTENEDRVKVQPEPRPTEDLDPLDDNVLLPPARREAPYPTMPTISALPGTTASPIRIPFGSGRGELIDLPGLSRGKLETLVRPEHREDLVMKARITPPQHVIKPGQSLLLGGLIRITPTQADTMILAYPFTPIKAHLTSTEKAIRFETEGKAESSGVPLIIEEDAGKLLTSAGKFQLKWDVTKQRAGPLTSRSAVGLKTNQLPFAVLSADILLEGVGWIELVAQVRKKSGVDGPAQIPEVEVFSPEGKYVGIRRPMNAWLLGGLRTRPSVKQRKQRPRQAMASTQ